MNIYTKLALLAGVTFAGASTALATTVTETATMNVTASVYNTCTFDAPGDLAFGNIDPTNPHTQTQYFTLVCSQNEAHTGATVTVDGGQNSSHQSGGDTRAMTDGSSNYLDYKLKDNAVAGQLANPSANITLVETNPSTGVYDERGTLKATTNGMETPTGTYSDTLTLTATYTP